MHQFPRELIVYSQANSDGSTSFFCDPLHKVDREGKMARYRLLEVGEVRLPEPEFFSPGAVRNKLVPKKRK